MNGIDVAVPVVEFQDLTLGVAVGTKGKLDVTDFFRKLLPPLPPG